MTDDGGVLGNLPRSRPGRRSEKRDAAPSGPKAAQRAPRSAPRRAAPPPEPAGEGDPVGGALRTVGGLAATGARVANGVARGVLRRLPRP